jgi:hypothetical protein
MAAINGVEIKYKDNGEDDERDDRFGESFSFAQHLRDMNKEKNAK